MLELTRKAQRAPGEPEGNGAGDQTRQEREKSEGWRLLGRKCFRSNSARNFSESRRNSSGGYLASLV